MSGRKDIKIDFNQGLDARLIDDEMTTLLSRCKWDKYLRMACDKMKMLPIVSDAAIRLINKGMHPRKIFVYVLVQDIEDALIRIDALNEIGVEVFAQPYRDFDTNTVDPQAKHFARWVNCKQIFKTCKWEEYERRII